jgi:vacuolar-type H+-ATPase subunit H
MDIAARLQQLEELVAEAKSMPLSTSVLINREEVLELIQEMRSSMPEEIKQARWVVKDREQLLTKARKDAEGVVQQALDEQRRLVQQEEVVRASTREAERILEEAREQARQMRLEGEDYMDQKLAAFEATLTRTLEQIAQIREAEERQLMHVGEQLQRALQQVGRGRERLKGGTLAEEHLAEEGTRS